MEWMLFIITVLFIMIAAKMMDRQISTVQAHIDYLSLTLTFYQNEILALKSQMNKMADSNSDFQTELEQEICRLRDELSSPTEANLETTISTLQNKVDNNLSLHDQTNKKISDIQTQLTNEHPGPVVAFNATHPTEYRHEEYICKFSKVNTNVGGAFNPDSGVFHCPVSGLYQFTVSITNYEDWNGILYLCVSTEGKIINHPVLTHKCMSTRTTVYQFEEGTLVFVKAWEYNHDEHTCIFSGHLISMI